MRVIRLLQAIHFDRRERRFRSLAFQASGRDGGISVVDENCVRSLGNSICEHVAQHYAGVARGLTVFWSFDTNELPFKFTLEYQPSPSGDKCHINIKDVKDKDAKRYFKSVALKDFCICDGSTARQLTEKDLDMVALCSEQFYSKS